MIAAKSIVCCALSLLSVLILGGCTHRNAESVTPRSARPSPAKSWPSALSDLSVVWSADPGIELTTGAAVAVRAYLESYLVVSMTNNDRFLYPGFEQAVDANQEASNPADKRALWPSTDNKLETPVGTERNHILNLSQTSDSVIAVVCQYFYGVATPNSGGGYDAVAPNQSESGPGIYVTRVELKQPVPAQTISPQTGPAKAPSTDVFGGWRVIGHLGGYFVSAGLHSEWPEREELRQQCVAKAPDSQEQRQSLIFDGPHTRSDFPTLPPYPGWPEAGPT